MAVKADKQARQCCVPLPLATGRGDRALAACSTGLPGPGPAAAFLCWPGKFIWRKHSVCPPRPQHRATRPEGHFGSGICRVRLCAHSCNSSRVSIAAPPALCALEAQTCGDWSTVRAGQKEDGRLREARGWSGRAVSLLKLLTPAPSSPTFQGSAAGMS